jgi:hypothetical protein
MSTGERAGDEWLRKRYDCVTATDVAVLFGCGYLSRCALLVSKIRKSDPLKNAGKRTREFLSFGQIYEAVAMTTFEDWARVVMPDHKSTTPGLCYHGDTPIFAGTPDYIVTNFGSGVGSLAEDIVVEFKCHCWPSYLEARPIADVETLPAKYWIQVQGYMEILDLERAILWSWTSTNGATAFEILRDREWFDTEAFPRICEFHEVMQRCAADETILDKEAPRQRWVANEKAELLSQLRLRITPTTTLIGHFL